MSCLVDEKSIQLEDLKTEEDERSLLSRIKIIRNSCFDFLSNKVYGSVRQPPANTEIVEEKKASTVSEIQKQNEMSKERLKKSKIKGRDLKQKTGKSYI